MPAAGTTEGFNEDDEPLGGHDLQRQADEGRGPEKTAKELKTFEAEISDTEAYLDEAAERLRGSSRSSAR